MRRKNLASEMQQRGGGESTQFSVNHTFLTQNIPAEPGHVDPLSYLQSITENIQSILNDALRMHGAIKILFNVEYVHAKTCWRHN